MYTTEITELRASIEAHIEQAQHADLEREELRLQRFQSLLMFIDESHGALMKLINESFATVRKEVESVMADQRDHANKMDAKQEVIKGEWDEEAKEWKKAPVGKDIPYGR